MLDPGGGGLELPAAPWSPSPPTPLQLAGDKEGDRDRDREVNLPEKELSPRGPPLQSGRTGLGAGRGRRVWGGKSPPPQPLTGKACLDSIVFNLPIWKRGKVSSSVPVEGRGRAWRAASPGGPPAQPPGPQEASAPAGPAPAGFPLPSVPADAFRPEPAAGGQAQRSQLTIC